jgi:hypothetical protein
MSGKEETEPTFQAAEGEVVFGVRGQFTVRIRPDGAVLYEGSYQPDEAAKVFWEAVARAHPNVNFISRAQQQEGEVRDMLAQTIEVLMLRVGKADLHCERLRRKAADENATEHDKFMADIAMRNLEAEVHSLIEFARGLAQARRIVDN